MFILMYFIVFVAMQAHDNPGMTMQKTFLYGRNITYMDLRWWYWHTKQLAKKHLWPFSNTRWRYGDAMTWKPCPHLWFLFTRNPRSIDSLHKTPGLIRSFVVSFLSFWLSCWTNSRILGYMNALWCPPVTTLYVSKMIANAKLCIYELLIQHQYATANKKLQVITILYLYSSQTCVIYDNTTHPKASHLIQSFKIALVTMKKLAICVFAWTHCGRLTP